MYKIGQTEPNSVVLDRAADVLEEHGWGKDWFGSPELGEQLNVQLCVESALMKALGIEEYVKNDTSIADAWQYIVEDDGSVFSDLEGEYYAACPVYKALEEHLEPTFKERYFKEIARAEEWETKKSKFLNAKDPLQRELAHAAPMPVLSQDFDTWRADKRPLTWNDWQDTTKEEVISTLRSAAEAERVKEHINRKESK